MKIVMGVYNARYNLRCPRCGNDEWSEKAWYGTYHKCLHCGIDVETDERAVITAVVEMPFIAFTPNTYDEIRKELETVDWKINQEETHAHD